MFYLTTGISYFSLQVTVSRMAFDSRAAYFYGKIRAGLETDGIILPHADIQIPSIAFAYDLTVITDNARHFTRIQDLKVENWIV